MPVPYDRAALVRYNTGHECPLWFPHQGWPVGARWWRYEHEGDGDWREIPLDERPKPEPSGVCDEVRLAIRRQLLAQPAAAAKTRVRKTGTPNIYREASNGGTAGKDAGGAGPGEGGHPGGGGGQAPRAARPG